MRGITLCWRLRRRRRRFGRRWREGLLWRGLGGGKFGFGFSFGHGGRARGLEALQVAQRAVEGTLQAGFI